MHTQIVLDKTGDTRHEFKPDDQAAVAEAMKRFADMTKKGYVAIALSKDGSPGTLMRKFDPTVETTMFQPQLVGG